MNKKEFEQEILSNYDDIESISVNITHAVEDSNVIYLDCYIKTNDDYITIFESDSLTDNEENLKEVKKLQKKWAKKVQGWMWSSWDIKIKTDEINI